MCVSMFICSCWGCYSCLGDIIYDYGLAFISYEFLTVLMISLRHCEALMVYNENLYCIAFIYIFIYYYEYYKAS